MKKIIFILILATTFCSILVAQEKDKYLDIKVTWGVKAEVNISGFFVSGMSEISSKMRTGGTGGGFINVELTKLFALQGEILWHYKSSDFIRQGNKGDFQYWGTEIPMYAMFRWNLKNDRRVYIGIGPYGEFGYSAKLKRAGKTIDLYEKDKATELSAMEDFNSGFGVTAGYEFANGLQINVGYKVSITNVLDANSSSIKMHPETVSIGLGYRFK
ncbi:MAG: PorT family protein [Prevotella sp.]|jgi:opacity protein-like surface antigen|nr:PorT family protein [Prevotella sp.]